MDQQQDPAAQAAAQNQDQNPAQDPVGAQDPHQDPPGVDPPGQEADINNGEYLIDLSQAEEDLLSRILDDIDTRGSADEMANELEAICGLNILMRIIKTMGKMNQAIPYIEAMLREKSLNVEELAFLSQDKDWRIYRPNFEGTEKIILVNKTTDKMMAVQRLQCEDAHDLVFFILRKQTHIKPEVLKYLAEVVKAEAIMDIMVLQNRYPHVLFIVDENMPHSWTSRNNPIIRNVEFEFDVISNLSGIGMSTRMGGRQTSFNPDMTTINQTAYHTAMDSSTIYTDPNAPTISRDPLKKREEFTYVRKPKVSDPQIDLKGVQKTMNDYGFDKKTADLSLAFTASMMTALAANQKGRQDKDEYQAVKINYADDYTINRFAPNIKGRTLEQVLGQTFLNARFSTPQMRDRVKNGIVDFVLKNPNTDQRTLDICLHELGNRQPALEITEDTGALMLYENYKTEMYNEIQEPRTGNQRTIPHHCIKSLKGFIGEELLSSTKNYVKSMKTKLNMITAVINSERLSEEASIDLIIMVSDSELASMLSILKENEKSFYVLWKKLSTMANVKTDKNRIYSEICDLVNTRPESIEHFLNILGAIHTKAIKYFGDIENRDAKKSMIEELARKQIIGSCEKHYPNSSGRIIEDHMRQKYKVQNVDQQSKQKSLTLRDDYDEIEFLIITVGNVLRNSPLADLMVQVPAEPRRQGARVAEAAVVPEKGKENSREGAGAKAAYANTRGPYRGNSRGGNSYRGSSRGSYRGSYRGGRGGQYQNYQRGNYRGQGQRSGNERRFHGNCYLCNYSNHAFRDCRIYPGEKPGQNICKNCNGYHTSACKKKTTYAQE